MFFLLLGLVLIWFFVELGQNTFIPWFNKYIFSKIWQEESRPVIAREAVDRLKELCVDEDVPAETAVFMTAQENGISEQDMLRSFNADDAQELVKILSGKKPNLLPMMLKKLKNIDKKNMGR